MLRHFHWRPPVPEGDCYVGGPEATEEPSSWENKEKLLISMEMGKHRRRAKLELNPTVNVWGQILWQINKTRTQMQRRSWKSLASA